MPRLRKKGKVKVFITAKKAGKATIKVKLTTGKTLKCKVKVKNVTPQPAPVVETPTLKASNLPIILKRDFKSSDDYGTIVYCTLQYQIVGCSATPTVYANGSGCFDVTIVGSKISDTFLDYYWAEPFPFKIPINYEVSNSSGGVVASGVIYVEPLEKGESFRKSFIVNFPSKDNYTIRIY